LEQLGFIQKRQRGSHVIMRRGSHGCSVPLHKEVRLGTLDGLLHQAHVSIEEFLGAEG
jgi:predicted RNA binding protein YcfA (HicA-like mRNA interferase family)